MNGRYYSILGVKHVKLYSQLNASIGWRREAWRAGQRPKTTPMNTENSGAMMRETGSMTTAQPSRRPIALRWLCGCRSAAWTGYIAG